MELTETMQISRRTMLALAAGSMISGCKPADQEAALELNSTEKVETPPETVNGCHLVPERLKPFDPCMMCCGPEFPRDEWNHSTLHPHLAVYACGCLFVPGRPNVHEHDPEEIVLCEKLSAAMASILKGVSVNYSEGSSTFDPFFVTINRGAEKPTRITVSLIRTAFNGAIYPQAKIRSSVLQEYSLLWESFVAEDAAWLAQWRKLVTWCERTEQIHSPVFVAVGDGDKMSDRNFGCVFPRLVVGLTEAGSLVGVMAHSVQT